MARSSSALEELEDRLEGAERILSRSDALGSQQAERVAQRMDRLASQLLEVSEPPPVEGVHQRFGTAPAAEELEGLANRMGPADGEG